MSGDNVVSVEEYRAALAADARRRNKYGAAAVRDETYGWFASTGEHRRWHELLRLQEAGYIANLRRQVRYPLVVGGVKVADYVADFVYDEHHADDHAIGRRTVVEDFKGQRTEGYKLKKRLMLGCHGIEIRETGKG